jgi:hypothetical protein
LPGAISIVENRASLVRLQTVAAASFGKVISAYAPSVWPADEQFIFTKVVKMKK